MHWNTIYITYKSKDGPRQVEAKGIVKDGKVCGVCIVDVVRFILNDGRVKDGKA